MCPPILLCACFLILLDASDQSGVLTQSSPSFVLASAELDISCPEEITETMTCTALLDSSLLVNGSIVTPVPEPPNVEERLKI